MMVFVEAMVRIALAIHCTTNQKPFAVERSAAKSKGIRDGMSFDFAPSALRSGRTVFAGGVGAFESQR
jgi:hypothetical protein